MNIAKILLYCFFIILLQSCVGTVNPGFRSGPLNPAMIRPPMTVSTNENLLPKSPNFVQSFKNYKKSKTNSNFGALVRIIEFEYDITDSFSITPRVTSGFDEGEMTGLLTIVVENYELIYENKSPQIREYVEEVSYESTKSYNRNRTYNYQVSPNTIRNSLEKKPEQIYKRSQLYNTATYQLEREDVRLIQSSKTLYYIVQLQNCELIIYPSKEQRTALKKMLLSHYTP